MRGTEIAAQIGMSQIVSFRDLIAWQLAMDLTDLVFDVTEQFPRREWFGLSQQMRRAAVSIPSNIAEGSRRRTAGYTNHLVIALGSHGELDTQCEIAARRGFIKTTDQDKLRSLLAETGRVTHGLLRSLDPSI